MALDLIQPLIPNAQENAGPSLFMHSLGQGLQAFARFSEIKRQSEMDLLKLAEHERLSQEQHELEREKMAMDADYRTEMLGIHRDLADAKIERDMSAAQAWKNGTARAWQNTAAFNQQKEQLVNEVNDHATELKLNDPVFATKNPVEYAANVLRFESAWQQSPLPEVRHAVKTFRTLADQQKIPVRIGARLDDSDLSKGPVWKGGALKQVPVWQVVQALNNPDEKEVMIEQLKASGHIHDLQYQVPGDPETLTPWQRAWNYLGVSNYAPAPKTVKKPELSPYLKKQVEESAGVTFEREPSRVPPAMLRKSDARGTTPTEMPERLPDPDLPPLDGEPQARMSPRFDETQTDLYIRHAKDAVAQGAPAAVVAQRLQEIGINPSALFDVAA